MQGLACGRQDHGVQETEVLTFFAERAFPGCPTEALADRLLDSVKEFLVDLGRKGS